MNSKNISSSYGSAPTLVVLVFVAVVVVEVSCVIMHLPFLLLPQNEFVYDVEYMDWFTHTYMKETNELQQTACIVAFMNTHTYTHIHERYELAAAKGVYCCVREHTHIHEKNE